MIRRFVILLSLFFTLSCPGQAPQISNEKSHDISDPVNSLYKLYFAFVTTPNELINGKEYLPYFFHGKTTPLLFSGESVNAILKIRGREYLNIRLQYDTYLDEVIYTDTSRMIDNVYPRIALNKDIVEGFDLISGSDTIHFRNFRFTDNSENEMESGFYEIAYDGDTRFIIRHKSTQYNYNALNEYKYSPSGYIFAGGKYNLIKNNKTFLPLFGESSEEIRAFLKSSKIKTKRAEKNEIVRVLEYSDTLKQAKGKLQ